MFWGPPICYHCNVTFNTISCLRSSIGRAVFMNTFFWHFLVKILEVMLEFILENKIQNTAIYHFYTYLIDFYLKFNYMLILPDLHRFLLIVTPKTMCLLKNVQCQRNL